MSTSPYYFGDHRGQVLIRGIELVQTIQTIDHCVPLIEGKKTVARVYASVIGHAPVAERVRLELAWKPSGAVGEHYLSAMNTVELGGDDAKIELDELRRSLVHSFNAILPVEATKGDIELRVSAVRNMLGHRLPIAGSQPLKVSFKSCPPLRVRAVGLRYLGENDTPHTPHSHHFAHLKSFLGRAFPAPEVEWSQIVVDAPRGVRPKFGHRQRALALAYLAELRDVEISAGGDPRVHYYGLIDDASGRYFMRGEASSIPDDPLVSAVAIGPCGAPSGRFAAWDADATYADWYGAHELGHTFGRYHPGYPRQYQNKDDPHYPHPQGRCSGGDGEQDLLFVGLDVGDPSLGLDMRVLPGDQHHDLMTYNDHQWISAYTYTAILERLRAKEHCAPQGG